MGDIQPAAADQPGAAAEQPRVAADQLGAAADKPEAAADKPGWARRLLGSIPLPAAPATEPWQLSVAGFLRARTDLPATALKPLGVLDRFGEIAFGPTSVGFDGVDIPWQRVRRLVVRDVVEVVSDTALTREAEKIRKLLPPIPGRKWVVDHALGLLGDLAGPRLKRHGDVVSEIVYRGRLGTEKTLQAGLFAAVVQAARPQIVESLLETARVHGFAEAEPRDR